jgi:hypothetical protein
MDFDAVAGGLGVDSILSSKKTRTYATGFTSVVLGLLHHCEFHPAKRPAKKSSNET